MTDKQTKHTAWKSVFLQLCVTVLTALFGAVYERFSHEVYSYYMIYAFSVPLVLGVLPGVLLLGAQTPGARPVRSGEQLRTRRPKRIPASSLRLWNAGILTLTVGSLFQGVLEIYGSTNRLTILYLIAGVFLLTAGLIGTLVSGIRRSVSFTAPR